MKFIVLAFIQLFAMGDLIADFILTSSNINDGDHFVSIVGSLSIDLAESIYSDDAHVPEPSAIGTYFHDSTYLYKENFPSVFSVTDNFSIKMWVYFIDKQESPGTVFALSLSGDSNTEFPVSINQQAGKLYLSTTLSATASFDIDLGKWKLIILTSSKIETDDYGSISLYASDDADSYTSLSTGTIHIESSLVGTTQLNFGFIQSSFIGFLFEVIIYNHVLQSNDFLPVYSDTCDDCSVCDPDYDCLEISALYPVEYAEYPGLDLCYNSCNYFCNGKDQGDCFCDNGQFDIRSKISTDEQDNKCCDDQIFVNQKISEEKSTFCCEESIEVVAKFASESNLSEDGFISVYNKINSDENDNHCCSDQIFLSQKFIEEQSPCCGEFIEVVAKFDTESLSSPDSITINHEITSDEKDCEKCGEFIEVVANFDSESISSPDSITINHEITNDEKDCEKCGEFIEVAGTLDSESNISGPNFITINHVISNDEECCEDSKDFITIKHVIEEDYDEECEGCFKLITITHEIHEDEDEDEDCLNCGETIYVNAVIDEKDCEKCDLLITLTNSIVDDSSDCPCEDFITLNQVIEEENNCDLCEIVTISGEISEDNCESCTSLITISQVISQDIEEECVCNNWVTTSWVIENDYDEDCSFCSNNIAVTGWFDSEDNENCNCGNKFIEIDWTFDDSEPCCDAQKIVIESIISGDSEEGCCGEYIEVHGNLEEDECCENELIEIYGSIIDEECCDSDIVTISGMMLEEEQCCDTDLIIVEGSIDDENECCDADLITIGGEINDENECCDADLITIEGSIDEYNECCSPNLITIGGSIDEDNECCSPDLITIGGEINDENECCTSDLITVEGSIDENECCDTDLITIGGSIDDENECCTSDLITIEGSIDDENECCTSDLITIGGSIDDNECCSDNQITVVGFVFDEIDCCTSDLIEVQGNLFDDEDCCTSDLITIASIIYDEEEACCNNDLISVSGILFDDLECCYNIIKTEATIFDEDDCCTSDLFTIEATIIDDDYDQNSCCYEDLIAIDGFIFEDESCCATDLITVTGFVEDECFSCDLITISSIIYDEDDDSDCCISDLIELSGFIDDDCCNSDLITLSGVILEEECCYSDLIKVTSILYDEEDCCNNDLVTLQGIVEDSESCCDDPYISLYWNLDDEDTCCDNKSLISLTGLIYDEEECSDCSSQITISSSIYDDEDCDTCSGQITVTWIIEDECSSCSESQEIALTGLIYDEEDCDDCNPSLIKVSGIIDDEDCSYCSDPLTINTIILYEDDCPFTCDSGEFYDGTQCAACGELCETCISQEECKICNDRVNMEIDSENLGNCKCKDGTFLNGEICEKCGDLCEICSDNGKCVKCDGEHLEINDGKCECESGYYLNNGVCTECGRFCKECDSSGICTTCNDINTMKFSIENPEECECNTGTYDDGEKCPSCGSLCAECKDINTCITCTVPAKMKISTTNPGTCECSSGFYKSSSDSCSACTNLCSTCTSETSCLTCVANTNTISSSNSCSCKDGYFKSSNSCKLCPSLCTSCYNSTVCATCTTNAALNTNSICACNTGFFASEDSCIATCNSLCTTCDKNDGNKCSACVTNAELTGNTCACTDNSAYDSASKSCVCKSGYLLVNSKCITCKNYFGASDIVSIYFTSTYAAIMVEFKYYLDTSLDSSCSKTVSSTSLSKLGTNPSCTWIDNKYLRIILGTDYTIKSETLYLDGRNILKKHGSCTTNYQDLSGTIQLSSTPSISSIISGQTSLSLLCGTESIVYSGEKSYGSAGSLTYSWSSSISPQISSLSTYISSQSSSKISISRSYFSTSVTTTLTVSLTVSNKFGNKSTSSMTTTIEPYEVLTVTFDQGNSITILASDSKTIKAAVKTLCSTSSDAISWEWESIVVDGAPSYDSTSILAKSKSPNKLEIDSNSLPAGGTYKFRAIATQTVSGVTYTGNSTITITTSSSPLVIVLSRTSGDISPSVDFVVSGADSYDPDDISGTLSYAWSCITTDSDSTCIGADNNALFTDENKSSLTIPASKLVKGSSYDLTLKITKDTRTSSSTITVSVINTNSDTSISITLNPVKVNPQSVVSLKAAVDVSTQVTLTWSQISGTSVSISPNTLPTVSFKSGTLSEGSSYSFQLSVLDTSINLSLNIEMPVTTNSGGTCTGTVSISPDSGKALSTSFSVSISGCVDKDEEDYPIYYKYTDTWKSKTFKLSSITESSSISSYMYPGTNKVLVYVCDQLNTCSSYSKSIEVESYSSRFLQTTSLLSLYQTNIIDPDEIPATITLFCSSATLDSTLFSTMWTDLQSYVSENTASSNLLNDALSSVLALTGQTTLMSSDMFDVFIEWLENYENTNDVSPNSDSVKYAVDIAHNYLTFGESISFNGSSIESYVIKTNSFIQLFVKKYTSDDLVTQTLLDSDINIDTINLYKTRDFPGTYSNSSLNFSDYRSITFPESLPFKSTDITDLRANYYTYSNDYSDIAEISFGLSGNYSNYTLTVVDENDYDYKSSTSPVSIELPFYKNVSIAWRCLYYNQTGKAWVSDSTCKVKEVKNSSVVLETTHFSMYKLSDTPNVPPDPFYPSSASCEDNNYPAIYILSVIAFIGIILIPVAVLADRAQNTPQIDKWEVGHASTLTQRYLMNETNMTAMVPPNSPKEKENIHDHTFGSPSQMLGPDEEEIIEGSSPSSEYEECSMRDMDVDEPQCTEKSQASVIGPTENLEETDIVAKPEKAFKEKSKWLKMIEGHLTFGLFFYRSEFSRIFRLLTLFAVIIFELLLEGLFLYGFETIDEGSSKSSTKSIFGDYEPNYFGYTIFAIALAMLIEIYLIIAFSIDKQKAPYMTASGVLVGAAILFGSIIGVIWLSLKFCHDWNGYWAASFLFGILIEVFVVQTIYMLCRYLIIEVLPENKKRKNFTLA